MQESGLTEITPWICTLALWGQRPLFSHPELPWRAQQGAAVVCSCWMAGLPLLPGFPWGLKGSRWQAAVTDDYNILCLIWQKIFHFSSIWFLIYRHQISWCCSVSSVAQSCPTPCYPMNHSTPDLAVHRQLPEFTQTHVHWVGDAIQPSHPLSSLLFLPSVFPRIRVFSNESVVHIRWPKYWSFSFSISPSNEYSGLI